MQRLTARSASGVVCVLALVTSFATHAQQTSTPAATAPAGREIPRPEELEPGVDTTKSPPPTAPAEKGVASAPIAPPPGAPPAATAPAVPGSASAANTTPATSASANSNTAKNPKGKSGPDRLELGATDVRGNSELPTVMYVVPWKRSDLGDLVGKPVNSLVDEVLQPLDRDVFRRENRYYEAVKPEEAAAKSDAVQGSDAKP